LAWLELGWALTIFCENAHKQFVVENAINFIPRIMLGFRPDYAVQLSMRFIIRLVSGHTEIEEICKIIENNERLVKYFTHIYEFSIHIYKGGLCYNQNDYNEELNKEVIQSYIELMNCERYEEQEFVRISGSFSGQKFEIFLVSYYSITKAGFVLLL